MAEALVSSVLDQIGSVIWQKLKEEAKLVLGVQKQVENLTPTLRSLQFLLSDAEKKQMNDAEVKDWLEKLKDITYDADDILDEWRTRIQLSQLNPVTPTITEKIMYYLFSPCSSHIPASCSCFIPDDLPQHHRIATEIQGINERLDPIDRNTIRDRLTPLPTTQSLPRRATSSFVNVAEIHGRDDDKTFIVNWLLSESSRQEIHMPVPILSIVGTGGFGKTTLAQLVFNQEKTRFERAIWVCISQPFDREKVAKEIIEQATENKAGDFVGWQALHQQLSTSIKGKRFLIVLDDVWSKDRKDWDPFRLSLNGGAQGSRIVVTTRYEAVAIMMGSKTHRLGGLSKQDCWLLFQQIAFAERSQKERETLKETGEEIAAKCKGVPLAAKTIASLMRFKRTKKEWRDVLKSDIWELPQEDDDFLPSLLLSYQDLPSELKQCFLYCAIFPKDDIIEKDMLVKLWMAQGFLRSDGVKELETTGEEYFDELAMRSFFQDFKEDDEGKIIKCKMHDLVHDFAQFLTKNECSILENSDTIVDSEKLRHINAGDIDIKSFSSIKVKKLRSMILGESEPIHSELFCQVTCLRSLDLSSSNIEKLPDEVERLLHLRYLDLSNTELTELPEMVCNLYNLQTLRLNRCYNLCKLPEGIGKLSNLRHLELEGTLELIYFSQGFGKLKHLRTLHKFVVSNASGGCKLEELKDLNLISGELEITGLWQAKNIDDGKRAELQRKANIVSLTLIFDELLERVIIPEENMEKRMEEIIEVLQPHNNLEQLEVHLYPGLAFPSWMSTMSNIVELNLCNCPKLEALPATISKLPSLVRFKLQGMCWSGDMLGICGFVNGESMPLFPKLTSLKLNDMPKWEEEIHEETIAPTISIMPNLRFLSIKFCPKLKVIPNYLFSHNLKELFIKACPELTRMPSLESLDLIGDVPIINGSNNNHNLKSFKLFESRQSSLPQGLNHFKSLQELEIKWCDSIDFNPEEELSSEHFPNLRKLTINRCGALMRKRCSKVNWSNLSHISEIYAVNTWIRGNQSNEIYGAE